MKNDTKVLVMIADQALGQFSQVVEKLRKAGLKVVNVMENIGVISGEVPETKLEALSRIDGVAGVEKEREVHLSLPE